MANLRICWVWGWVALLASSSSPCFGDELRQRIKEIIDHPRYEQSRWGICVVDARSGKTLYAHNADQLFAPASVTKLFTCAAALSALGENFRFETPVFVRGKFENGELFGELILIGQGDPVLGGRRLPNGTLAFCQNDHTYAGPHGYCKLTAPNPLAGLIDLAKQVKQSGVRVVHGDVMIDDRLFECAESTGSGPSKVCPIVVNDNVVDVMVTPATIVGELATVELRPKTAFIKIDVRVQTVSEDKAEVSSIRVASLGNAKFAVRGEIAVNSEPRLCICCIEDPKAYARAIFIEALRGQGVIVHASIHRVPKTQLPYFQNRRGLKQVAMHRSLPLRELLKVTMKTSHNLYASTLPMLLAAKEHKRTLREGMLAQGRELERLGLRIRAVSLQSGAGGARGDLVSPKLTVELLQRFAKNRGWSAYTATLPIMGVDGSLAEAVPKSSPTWNRVWAKPGAYVEWDSLNERMILRSKTLAGLMRTGSGRSLYFAIFLNDLPLEKGETSSVEGKTITRLLEILSDYVR